VQPALDPVRQAQKHLQQNLRPYPWPQLDLDPQHYIVTKGILQIFSDNDVALSMALENGITLMSRQIDPGAPIYINGNHFDEELIMSADGKLEEGLNPLLD
jgi:hypothetical protein